MNNKIMYKRKSFASFKQMSQRHEEKSIALITMYGGRGGAPKAIRRLYHDLRENYKQQVDFFVYESVRHEDLICKTPTRKDWGGQKGGLIGQAESYMFGKITSWFNKLVFCFRLKSQFQFFLEGKFLSIRDFDSYKIVILSWWQLLANTKDLNKREGAIVFVMHDMWGITGGCSYSQDCCGYEDRCEDCPALRGPFKRKARINATRKIELLNKSNSYVMVTSDWMRRMCISAGVLERNIYCLHNYYPREVFKRITCDRGHRLQIYFVGDVKDTRKGFNRLIEALRLLDETSILRMSLKILGCNRFEIEKDLEDLESLEVECLGISNSEVDQVKYYNEADWLICPSIQDNTPNTIGEAHMCGLPVLAISGTGAAEMVTDGTNGLIVDGEDLALSLSQAIRGLRRVSEDDRQKISLDARSRYTSSAITNLIEMVD